MTALPKLISAPTPTPEPRAALPVGELLSLREVSAKLHVTTRSLRRWAARGAFPPAAFVLPGRRHRWTAEQLAQFLQEHATSGVPRE